MARSCGLALIAIVLAGCGGGGTVVVKDTGLQGEVVEFERVVNEALGDVQNAAATPAEKASSDDEDAGPTPEDMILAAVQMVASSAQELGRSAQGSPHEADAKTIDTDGQNLLVKIRTRPNAAEARQGIEQIKSKAEALKAKF